MDREEYMSAALALAREAFDEGEIPVGCVIADAQGNIIGRGRNKREESHDATQHAELEAIRAACRSQGDWRLRGCTIYVTLRNATDTSRRSTAECLPGNRHNY